MKDLIVAREKEQAILEGFGSFVVTLCAAMGEKDGSWIMVYDNL